MKTRSSMVKLTRPIWSPQKKKKNVATQKKRCSQKNTPEPTFSVKFAGKLCFVLFCFENNHQKQLRTRGGTRKQPKRVRKRAPFSTHDPVHIFENRRKRCDSGTSFGSTHKGSNAFSRSDGKKALNWHLHFLAGLRKADFDRSVGEFGKKRGLGDHP